MARIVGGIASSGAGGAEAEMASGLADYSDVKIEDLARGQFPLAADADPGAVRHRGRRQDQTSGMTIACPARIINSIDMSPAFYCQGHQASAQRGHLRQIPTSSLTPARRWTRCAGSSSAPTKSLKGLLDFAKDTAKLRNQAAADLDALVAKMAVKHARAWGLQGAVARHPGTQTDQCRGHVAALVQRHAPKVDPMKDVAKMIRSHLRSAWAQHARPMDFWSINGLFRLPSGSRLYTHPNHQKVIFLIAGNLDFSSHQPSCWATHEIQQRLRELATAQGQYTGAG